MTNASLSVDDHARDRLQYKYLYTVLSRRAGGISIGVNLNPDGICNWHCVYCQVSRPREAVKPEPVDLERFRLEWRDLLGRIKDGSLLNHPLHRGLPDHLRQLRDLSFSGDGEPTTFKGFDEAVERVIKVRSEAHLLDSKLVLITDSACLHHEQVRRGLERMDEALGEIWGKLDVGTAEAYKLINRTQVPFQRVMKNLIEAASVRPIVIQTMMLRVHGAPPPAAEVSAYVERLREIESTGELKEIHIYTVARTPMEAWCTPLSDDELDAIVSEVRRGVRAEVRGFYGPPEGAR